MKHTILVLVENKPGVLARISGLFSARGFNIDSLAVGETEDPTVSRMTIIVDTADEKILEQIKKQLHKLIDIITVVDLTKKEFLERELVLLKVNVGAKDKAKLNQIIDKLPIRIIETSAENVILEIVGDYPIVKESLEALKPFGISQLTRTGRVAISKK
ncbi:MAG: acetolactate synthase small subunit [Candidatus Omnitrophota bacterium]